jgi:hypothetical protein
VSAPDKTKRIDASTPDDEAGSQFGLFGENEASTMVDFVDQHWVDMPEFKADNLKCIHTIKINFSSERDMVEFSKLVDKVITFSTKSFFWPVKEPVGLVYVDEK